MRLLPDSPVNFSQICRSSRPRFIREYTEFTRGSNATSDFLSIVASAWTAVVPWPPMTAPRLRMKVEKSMSRRVMLASSMNPIMPSGAARIATRRKMTPALTPSNTRAMTATMASGTSIRSMARIVCCSFDA